MIQRAMAIALLGAVIAAACLGGSCGNATESGSPSSVSVSGLYPSFNPDETRYVSRCGRGGEPIRVDSRQIDPGVRPGEDFALTVRSGDERRSYDVRCLPADFPSWKFEASRPVEPGLFVVAFRASREARPWVIVFDHEGVPRWWYSPDTRALWGQILSDGTVSWARSFGDGYGLDPRMAHEVRSLSGELVRVVRTKGEIVDGHEFRELNNGNVLVDTYAPGGKVNLSRFGGPENALAVFGEVQEIDPDGRVVWQWNSRDRIDLGETGRWWRNVLGGRKRNPPGLATFDPVHINSIEPRGPDEVVVSMRHTDAIYGIERSTGDIRWKLGGTETADSLRIVGDPAAKLFGGQHDARVDEDGDISVYDNGKDRPRRPRVVSYRLDLGKNTATYLGQLNDPRITTSHCCGSARPLEGGGWIVSWGDNPLVTGYDREGRIAFRLLLPASTFRAVPVPAGATSLGGLDRGLEVLESQVETHATRASLASNSYLRASATIDSMPGTKFTRPPSSSPQSA
ncbi:MAG TPA: arylsulfotransferase family protein [Solirubrobacterales bacterium]|nr:arylsulfotransferase family protein [Solirubrobacterales bacterium]